MSSYHGWIYDGTQEGWAPVLSPIQGLPLNPTYPRTRKKVILKARLGYSAVVLNLFHCWDPLNAIDVVWDPQVKIEKVCAPE